MQLHLTKGNHTKIIRCTSSLEPHKEHKSLKIGSNHVRITTDTSRTGNPPKVQLTSPEGVIYYVDEFPNPDIHDALMGTTTEIQSLMATYVPPTFADIFNTWERFSNNTHQGTGPFWGEAAQWIYQNGSIFLVPNTATISGFISPNKFTNYTHEVDLRGATAHPDLVGVVVAYHHVNNIPHMLIAVRTVGNPASGASGSMGYPAAPNGFALLYLNHSEGHYIHNHILRRWDIPTDIISSHAAGSYYWNQLSPTRVRVVKEANLVSVSATPFRSNDLTHPNTQTISIDLNNYPELEWAIGATPYGYMAISNPYSSYGNVSFHSNENATDTIYNTDNGDVWKYQNNTWGKISQKIWEYLPLPTLITSISHETYIVDDNTLTLRTS